jgi:uncharacterized protein YndB with AHSA1/START domain
LRAVAAAPASQPDADTTLRLRRVLPATRERVFRAWTDPHAIMEWWIPNDGFSVPAAEIDLRVGGRYRVTMRNPDGETFHLAGTYREVAAPERLVYTWNWEGTSSDIGETLVTVEFRDLGTTTEVVLTHTLPDVTQRDRHGVGWNGCLDRLRTVLAR